MVVNLKRFRKEYKLTQQQVADAIGIDRRQWSRYENEQNEIPLHYFKDICIKFKISADWLLEL